MFLKIKKPVNTYYVNLELLRAVLVTDDDGIELVVSDELKLFLDEPNTQSSFIEKNEMQKIIRELSESSNKKNIAL